MSPIGIIGLGIVSGTSRMRVLNSGAGISVGTGSRVRNCDRGDKGYRGHNYPDRFKVWISGQVRRVTKAIRREMRRRAAIEPVIGHLKDDSSDAP